MSSLFDEAVVPQDAKKKMELSVSHTLSLYALTNSIEVLERVQDEVRRSYHTHRASTQVETNSSPICMTVACGIDVLLWKCMTMVRLLLRTVWRVSRPCEPNPRHQL